MAHPVRSTAFFFFDSIPVKCRVCDISLGKVQIGEMGAKGEDLANLTNYRISI